MIGGLLPYLVSVSTMIAIYAMAALGLNLQFGIAGLFNVGCTAFIAVGAYACAIVTGPPFSHGLGGFGLPLSAGLAAGAGASGLLAWAIGAGLLRLRGDTLAIATFGLAAVVQLAVTNLPGITGGVSGLAGIPLRIGPSNLQWLALCLALCGVVWAVLQWLDNGRWGRTLRAVSDDPEAAASVGKNVARYRMQAFVAGAALMGVAGALFARNAGFVSPQDFLPVLTFQLYAMVIIGGAGRHAGAVLGAAIVWVIWSLSGQVLATILPPELQSAAGAVRMIAIAVVLLAMLLLRPAGLLPERVGKA